MKKILITFLLLLTTFLTFGQTPYYMRGKSFQIGEKDTTGKITWDTTTTITDCDILIKLDDKQLTVYSKTIQQYQVINFDGKMESGASKWYCSDKNGKTCNIYLMPTNNLPGYISLTVEFSDFIWFYICKPSN
jgi:hypothetical protein